MAKFLFVYRRGNNVADKMTPEEMQQHIQKWQKWIGDGLQQGWISDRGDALTQEGRVVNAKKVVLDGPFVESKEIVGGFSIVQADTIEAAADLAKGCPALLTGGSVEIRPLADFSTKMYDTLDAIRKKTPILVPSRWFRSSRLGRADRREQSARQHLLEWSMNMAKFLFIYRGDGEASHAKMTREEHQQHMQQWEKWIGDGIQKGWMLDPGDGLTPETRDVNAKVVTDGPYVESKEMVGGFSIVQADTIDAAAQLAKGCPGMLVGGTVEVRCLAGYTAKN